MPRVLSDALSLWQMYKKGDRKMCPGPIVLVNL